MSEGGAGGGGSVQSTFEGLKAANVREEFVRILFTAEVAMDTFRGFEIDPKSDKMMELFEYHTDYFLQRQKRQKSL